MRRTGEDILQEELLQEKAQVLGRAGESVSRVLERLREIEGVIDALLQKPRQGLRGVTGQSSDPEESARPGTQRVQAVNEEIRRYNALREEAKVRFYYLIVTREAMGLRRHHLMEEIYGIPPRKRFLREI